MVSLTPVAITKVKEILTQQTPSPTGLRVAVVGGGCSGFSYHMAFENQVNESSDNVYEFDGLKVMVDQNAPASCRLRAADAVLAHGGKAIELEDIEMRLQRLEQLEKNR